MKKKYRKDDEQNLLNSKAVELSNITEQSLEEILNELITNNYKQHNSRFNNAIKNKSLADELCGEINELANNILASYKNRNFLSVRLLRKKENLNYKNFADGVTRIIKFTDHLQDINDNIELIKNNINELYKYPAFKKQAYIPEFCLALSSFFKENIDIFFMGIGGDNEIKSKTASGLSKIISLGNKIIYEFFINITSGKDTVNKNSGGQIIYYSNIISLLELISINSIQFTSI